MSFDATSRRKIKSVVRQAERNPRNQASAARLPLIVYPIRWAVVKTTINAATGLTKGSGTVDLLCDKADGTGTDRVIEPDVKVWNGFQTVITPAPSGKVRRVAVGVVDGLLQVLSSDCPIL